MIFKKCKHLRLGDLFVNNRTVTLLLSINHHKQTKSCRILYITYFIQQKKLITSAYSDYENEIFNRTSEAFIRVLKL